jgi:hypothetical protein
LVAFGPFIFWNQHELQQIYRNTPDRNFLEEFNRKKVWYFLKRFLVEETF